MTAKRSRARSWDAFEDRFRPMIRPDMTVLWDASELPPRETINRHEWWTVLDCDGRLYLSAGFRFVNRFAYVRCTVPWTDDDRMLEYRYDD